MPLRMARGLTACALVLLGSAAGADLLVLRDGSRQSGALQACVADQCRLDGRPVPTPQIAWIGFGNALDLTGKGVAYPPAVADPAHDELHLADGTVATGTLEGISLGEVAFTDRSFDRAAVRWLHFAGAPGLGAPKDLLILRDGSTRSGSLQGCTRDGCTVDGRSDSRATLLWVGLEQGTPSPPTAADPAQDSVHLRDGSAHLGSLVGVNASQVVTVTGSYPRANVAWIHLAPPPPRRPNQDYEPAPVDDRPGAAPSPGETPTPTPSPPPTPSPSPTPSPGPSPGRGNPSGPIRGVWTRGALWVGAAEAQMSSTGSGSSTKIHVTAEVRMREYNSPLRELRTGRILGQITTLMPEGTVIHNQFSQIAGDTVCTGEGVEHVDAGLEDGVMSRSSVIYRRTAAGDLNSSIGFDVPRDSPIFVLDVVVRGNPHYTRNCVWPGGQSSDDDMNFFGILIGSSPIGERRMDPTVHHLEGGKMQGRYTVEGPIPGMRTVATWSVCPEGLKCDPPPPIGGPAAPTDDSCPKTEAADALLETCHAQREHMAEQLKEAWKDFQEEYREAQDNVEAYRATIAACGAWDATMKLFQFLAGPVEWTGAPEQPEEAQEFREAIKLISEITGKLIAGEDPLTVAHAHGTEDLATFQQSCEVVANVLKMLGVGSPESMEHMVDECSAPLPQDLFHGAEEYIQHLKAALEKMPEVRRQVNDLRQKDLDCLNLQYQAYAACVQRARCLGEPESSCDGLRPEGHWPDVP